MAKKGESKTKTIGAAATPNQHAELHELAKKLQRSASWIAGKFLQRGWARYRQDGLFDEPEEEGKTVVTEFVEPGEALPPPSPMLSFSAHAAGKRKPVPCVWCSKPSPGGICEDHIKELTASPKMAEAALNDLPYGTIELNEEGTILAYNKAEEELSRISHRKTIGKNFFTEIAKCTAVADFHGRYDAFLASGAPTSEEFSFTYDFPRGRGVDVLIRFIRVNERRALVLTRKAERGQKRRRGGDDDEES